MGAVQVQLMVDLGLRPHVPVVEPTQPSAGHAFDLFCVLDRDRDGKVSRPVRSPVHSDRLLHSGWNEGCLGQHIE